MTEIPWSTERFSTSLFPPKFSPYLISYHHHRLFLWKSRRPRLKILDRERNMIPQQWTPPCGNQCTHKYAALMQIPWRVFCKKGCNADGDTWEECLSECDEICYKDPVLKDQQWSAYIDRSPGSASYSQDCFHACVSGCGYKFDIPPEKVTEIHPNRPSPPPPPPPAAKSDSGVDKSRKGSGDIPCTSA